jgi:hypothetical protein
VILSGCKKIFSETILQGGRVKIRQGMVTCSLIFISVLFLALTACAKDETNEVLTPDRDAAESIAGALAVGTAGVVDQVADLCGFLTENRQVDKYLQKKFPSRFYTMFKSYDNDLQEWTISIDKSRGDSLYYPYYNVHRTYTLQYLNSDNEPQKYYVTDSDTAYSAIFKLTAASGIFLTRRISHQLDSLNCNWTVTNANLNDVTINGDYYRAAVDTISGWSRLRTSQNLLQLDLADVVAPRGSDPYLYQAVSGSISGSFDAFITFISGSAYSETTLHRDLDITLDDGTGHIYIGDNHFRADLSLGELTN